MMGIEKDGVIIKMKEGKNTYGIATGVDIDIPMLKMITATSVNMVIVEIKEDEMKSPPSTSGKVQKDLKPPPSTSGKSNSCYYYC